MGPINDRRRPNNAYLISRFSRRRIAPSPCSANRNILRDNRLNKLRKSWNSAIPMQISDKDVSSLPKAGSSRVAYNVFTNYSRLILRREPRLFGRPLPLWGVTIQRAKYPTWYTTYLIYIKPLFWNWPGYPAAIWAKFTLRPKYNSNISEIARIERYPVEFSTFPLCRAYCWCWCLCFPDVLKRPFPSQ